MRKYLVISALVLLFNSCSSNVNNANENRSDTRIVSLSKHLTEMIFALGKGSTIVACDLSSTYPDSAKLLTKVGYHRSLNAEGIISMRPGLVLHSNDIGPETVLPQLKAAGLHVMECGKANTPDSAKLLMKQLGALFHTPERADTLNALMDRDLSLAAKAREALAPSDTPSVMIIHFGRANNVYFVLSGRGGAADNMIELAGGKVAGYDGKGARQISPEAIVTANPDIIIATDYGFDQMGSMEKFIENIPGIALTRAGKNKRIVRFEEHDLVYFGPRSGRNILQLLRLIHEKHTGEE